MHIHRTFTQLHRLLEAYPRPKNDESALFQRLSGPEKSLWPWMTIVVGRITVHQELIPFPVGELLFWTPLETRFAYSICFGQ